jgi:hypothetical protein
MPASSALATIASSQWLAVRTTTGVGQPQPPPSAAGTDDPEQLASPKTARRASTPRSAVVASPRDGASARCRSFDAQRPR